MMLAAMACGQAQAACTFGRNGVTSEGRMNFFIVDSAGGTCSYSYGREAGRWFSFDVETPPEHGVLRIKLEDQRASLTYVAARGYTGKDRFTVQLTPNNPSRLVFEVTVGQ